MSRVIPIEDRFRLVVAVYVVFRDGDKVLLGKRANTGYFDGSFSVPGGHVDGGETAIDAAIREAREELAAAVDREELRLAHVMHRFSETPTPHERIDLGFETFKVHPEIKNNEPHKCAGLEWFSLQELPENIVPEVKIILEKIAAGEPYSDYNF